MPNSSCFITVQERITALATGSNSTFHWGQAECKVVSTRRHNSTYHSWTFSCVLGTALSSFTLIHPFHHHEAVQLIVTSWSKPPSFFLYFLSFVHFQWNKDWSLFYLHCQQTLAKRRLWTKCDKSALPLRSSQSRNWYAWMFQGYNNRLSCMQGSGSGRRGTQLSHRWGIFHRGAVDPMRLFLKSKMRLALGWTYEIAFFFGRSEMVEHRLFYDST